MLMRLFLVCALLVASCSSAPEGATTTTSTGAEAIATTTSAVPPTPTTTTTAAPTSWPVAAGVLWDVESLTEMGMPTGSDNRTLVDLLLVGDRLIATGRDGDRPLALYSDDGGDSWQQATVEMPGGAEAAALGALAEHDGALVAGGAKAYGCPSPEALCDDFTSAVWRSDDKGETWTVVGTPTMSLTPESAIADIAAGPDGFVAIGNINGPAPNSSLVWTSPDGLTWSAGIPLPATTGGFTRAGELVIGPDTVVVTGDEILCGDWYDNGFWVIAAGFVRQGRAWTFEDGVVTAIDLAAAGLEQPPIPDCPDDGTLLEDPNQYRSGLGAVMIYGDRPAIAYGRAGVVIVAGDGSASLETFESRDPLDGESLKYVDGSDVVIGMRDAERNMLRTRVWADGTLQREGPPVPTGGDTTITALVAVGDGIIGVGFARSGTTDAVVLRSAPGSVGEETTLACDPGPGADCRGVDLSERDLSGLDLAGIDLRQADLTRTDLSGAILSGAFLGSAELSAVNLTGADLTGAHLAGVELHSFLDDALAIDGADFTGADLRSARIELTQPATFDSVLADDATFSVAGMVSGVTFRNASMVRTFLTAAYDADVASLAADFTGADMEYTYLSADMTGSTFAGIANSDANFAEDAVCPDGSAPVAESYGINRCDLDG
jgi:uncharacterized protein YjbI with pentapeptide repeats